MFESLLTNTPFEQDRATPEKSASVIGQASTVFRAYKARSRAASLSALLAGSAPAVAFLRATSENGGVTPLLLG